MPIKQSVRYLKAKYRAAAMKDHVDDDLQIDAGARVALGDDGAWVQAWVWVPHSDIK